MNPYPDVVATIANDYLERVRARLRMLPALEQEDFLREIRSHLYEAYDQLPGEDDVARILAALRNFGEPADVVADRLPGAMVRSGTRRNLPVYIIGGIVVMLFGIPLGFGGFGVLLGLLAALAGTLAAYYAVTTVLFLTGTMITLVGLMKFLVPTIWDRLLDLGLIQMSAPLGDFLDRLSPSDGGMLIILCGSTCLIAAWGLFRLGKHFIRGLRLLFSLTFDWMRRFASGVRRKLSRENLEGSRLSTLSFVTGK